jgi:hypothetical protein
MQGKPEGRRTRPELPLEVADGRETHRHLRVCPPNSQRTNSEAQDTADLARERKPRNA